MKKIVAIIGSLRKESLNRIVFENYCEINSGLFEFEEGDIADIPSYNEDLEQEPEAVIKLSKQIKESDGIIFFSPEYNYSVPGVLKNAIDYISKNDLEPLKGKHATIVGASPGSMGTVRMQYHLRQIGVFVDLRFLNKPEVMISKAADKISERKIKDDKTIEHLKKHAINFNSFINNQ